MLLILALGSGHCSLNWTPFHGGEGNGRWRQGSNKNREQEQLETFQAGKELSLVGLCRLWGDQDQESANTVIV